MFRHNDTNFPHNDYTTDRDTLDRIACLLKVPKDRKKPHAYVDARRNAGELLSSILPESRKATYGRTAVAGIVNELRLRGVHDVGRRLVYQLVQLAATYSQDDVARYSHRTISYFVAACNKTVEEREKYLSSAHKAK